MGVPVGWGSSRLCRNPLASAGIGWAWIQTAGKAAVCSTCPHSLGLHNKPSLWQMQYQRSEREGPFLKAQLSFSPCVFGGRDVQTVKTQTNEVIENKSQTSRVKLDDFCKGRALRLFL